MLESGGAVVGVLLLIFAHARVGDTIGIRCNVSSWCVEPEFRAYAAMLVLRALRHKDATYFNITPSPHILSILEAQGFTQYCRGRFIGVPALRARSRGTRVAVVDELGAGDDLPSAERDMLLVHQGYGCLSVTCRAADGSHPFVFAVRRKYGVLPFAVLIYCRTPESFARFAGSLGQFLARRGVLLVAFDANQPVRGMVGVFRDTNPKYFRGPVQPPLGDLAYSELALFDV